MTVIDPVNTTVTHDCCSLICCQTTTRRLHQTVR